VGNLHRKETTADRRGKRSLKKIYPQRQRTLHLNCQILSQKHLRGGSPGRSRGGKRAKRAKNKGSKELRGNSEGGYIFSHSGEYVEAGERLTYAGGPEEKKVPLI